MADGAVSFLLQQLTALLHDELNLLGGLEQEVQSIKHELEALRVFLEVADGKEETDTSIKGCVDQIREISFELQDVLDKYLLRFGRRRGTNGFVRFLNKVGDYSFKNLKARRQIASEIKTLNSRLEKVVKSQQIYRDMHSIIDHGSSSPVAETNEYVYDGRGDALFLKEEDVVGIEKPKKNLLEWILSTNSGLGVISVVGMGGLGKTTLVKKVYDDENVKTYFDRHVWIAVSDYKNDKHFLENLIKKLVGEIKESHPQGLNDMSIDEMRDFIRVFLKGKKFILVLDDVWRHTTWEVIKFALPRKGAHGCVIITTRHNNIGNEACSETNDHVYDLKPLSEKKSKELFFKKVFKENSCPDHLMQFAESILKRCKGLPLAIIVIGGLLATKESRAEVWDLFNRSLGSELEGDKRLWRLFSVSYNDLPYYLKYCFSYLSIFPEGGLLEKEKMLRLWTAEGFVLLKQNLNLEEVAAAYLNELCSRGLIQVAEKHIDGRSRGFRIHDLLRDYITSKSREHNIVNVYNGQKEPWSNHKIRRLAIQNSIHLSIEASNVEHLRSLILSNGGMEMRLIKEFVTRCRLLKVLDLRGSPIESIPDEVFKLYHLNYLCFRNTMIKVIPKSIKYLQKLETLDLKNTEVIQLPKEILKLRRLRHILVYKYKVDDWYIVSFGHMQSFRAPCNIGSLQYLQKLCFVDADEVTVREIGKLTELRRLGIAKLRSEHGNALCSSIANLTRLQSLTIGSSEESEKLDLDYSLSSSSSQGLPFLRALFLSGYMEKVPQWIPSLQGLSTLHLRWSKLRLDPLSCLQDLPSLTYLLIQDAYFEGLSFQAHGFKKLKVIRLYDLQFMKWMKVEEGSIPSLQKWEVCNCQILTEPPQGIEQLKNLKKLSFHDMPEEFVNMLVEERRSQGDTWRLAHVPHIYFSIKRNNGFREYLSLDEMCESDSDAV
ncbi:hypothetical protein C2S51_015051 [Perilla frutescens var. frutescens]|nr:hypothetical protein C2S51_015051 [Perilla frutescens var. frutescens]